MASASTMSPSRAMQECIDICNECHSICVATMQHCLASGKHVEARHIGLLLDCAEICQTSAHFMLRASELHGRTCAVCSEVCRACAESCQRMDANDPQMKQCAEVCLRCAKSCDEMARVM